MIKTPIFDIKHNPKSRVSSLFVTITYLPKIIEDKYISGNVDKTLTSTKFHNMSSFTLRHRRDNFSFFSLINRLCIDEKNNPPAIKARTETKVVYMLTIKLEGYLYFSKDPSNGLLLNSLPTGSTRGSSISTIFVVDVEE